MPSFSRYVLPLALAGALSVARTSLADVQPASRLPLLKVPHATLTPRVDAGLDDPAWGPQAGVALVPALSLSLQNEGDAKLAPVPTQVKLAWDEKFLYVRFEAVDNEIYAPYEGRDKPHYQGDVVELFLDAVGDSRQYIELEVSPKNQVFDQVFTLTAEARSDENLVLVGPVLERDWWSNLGWDMEGLRTASRAGMVNGQPGWVVDIALPAAPLLRRLGLQQFAPLTLRANLLRYEWPKPAASDPGKPGESGRQLIAMNWAPVRYGCPHISPQAMGFLQLVP